MKDTTGVDYKQGSYHCGICHGEHTYGTTYICSPMISNLPCSKCSNREYRKDYNYCPHCGHKL